jgi:polyhydroxyalkanoate synthesis regulator phasin
MTDGKQEEDEKGHRQRMSDGIRSGIGVLAAFKDALEETIQEARDRGDLSSDRAKEVVKEALNRAQAAASGARERLDLVNHSELEALEGAVEALRERVSTLERSVFSRGAQGRPGRGARRGMRGLGIASSSGPSIAARIGAAP